jgi:general secretion pathway protein A
MRSIRPRCYDPSRSGFPLSSIDLNFEFAGEAMYSAYYGFRAEPFNLTPDTRLLYFSRTHREAFDHLLFGIRQRKGFILLTGEVGSGKTTLCRALLEHLEPRFKTALILNPSMTATQLLRTIVTELGLKPKRDRVHNMEMLNAFLLEQLSAGNDVVVIIDEAQDLSPELLEEVRLLSNLETASRKLLQIVLVGQPELRDMIDRKELRQLRQRITVRYHVQPLSFEEMRAYISHRLAACRGNGEPTFNWLALRAIYSYSGGIPRLVNAACDKLLLYGYVRGKHHFTGFQALRSIRELEGRPT